MLSEIEAKEKDKENWPKFEAELKKLITTLQDEGRAEMKRENALVKSEKKAEHGKSKNKRKKNKPKSDSSSASSHPPSPSSAIAKKRKRKDQAVGRRRGRKAPSVDQDSDSPGDIDLKGGRFAPGKKESHKALAEFLQPQLQKTIVDLKDQNLFVEAVGKDGIVLYSVSEGSHILHGFILSDPNVLCPVS